jgi:hypothetical protein
MGGLEALIAVREGRKRNLDVSAAVLDPVLDPALVTEHLESFWHSVSTDSMQAYFHRILRGRYQEQEKPSFAAVLGRLRDHPEAQTSLPADAPSSWLCESREHVAIFLSRYDPVLGMAQRDFLGRCPEVSLVTLEVPGHTPLACRLETFDDMIAKVMPAERDHRTASAVRAEMR